MEDEAERLAESGGADGRAEADPEADPEVSDAAGSERKKSRKQSNPQRRKPAQEDQGEAAPEPPKPDPPKKRRSGAQEGEGSSGANPARKKKPCPPAFPSEGTFEDSSSEFDARDLARSFFTADYFEGREGRGFKAYDTFAAAARAEAVKQGQAVVTKEGSEIGVSFKGTNKKKVYEEKCPVYSVLQIQEVIRAVLTYNQSSSRRKASSGKHLITIQGLAERMPPLLWSMYKEYGKGTETKLRELVDEAEGSI
mmetsp:Transcript_13602/g.21249  ORF Transcript_13602/g.21249 Transcript_13602/m.21249 type:complete len:253 (+) Transcript_13602:1-759(+)